MSLLTAPAFVLIARPLLLGPGILRLAACFAAGIAALLIAVLMIRLIWRFRWGKQTARHYVHLRNRGNLPSELLLGAHSPARNLRFHYLLDGAALPVHKVLPAPAPRRTEPPPAPAPAAASLRPAPTRGAAQPAAQAAASAQTAAREVSGLTGLVIDILGTLGSILPGSLGDSLKQRSTRLQAQKAAVLARGQAPLRTAKQAEHLKESVGELKGKVGPAQPAAAPAAPAGSASSPLPIPAASLPAQPPVSPLRSLPCPEYVQLPALAPEASLRLEVRVFPATPYFKGESCYWLFTLPEGDPAGLPPEALEPQKSVRVVTFAGMPVYFWLLAGLLSAAALLANAAWFYLFIRWSAIIFS